MASGTTTASSHVRKQATQVVGLTVAICAVELVDIVLGQPLNRLGIVPRTISGLLGVPLAPFLHGGLVHLLSNAIPLLVLGLLAALGKRSFLAIAAEVIVFGGLGVWALADLGSGASSVHIGASGLVFGLFGYTLGRAWFTGSLVHGLTGVVALGLYWTLIFGVLPTIPGVSWESHLFGLIAGLLSARFERDAVSRNTAR